MLDGDVLRDNGTDETYTDAELARVSVLILDVTKTQCCQPWDFIPRSWDFFGTLGFSWDFYFKNATLGFFLGFFRIQKITLNINFLILINLLVRESYPVINIIR